MKLPPYFAYRDGALCIEEVAASAIAERFGTPTYVYSKAALLRAFDAYQATCAARGPSGGAVVCYAVKANSNLAVLQLFARAGAGFDIVSGGELARVLAAGGRADSILFSGVGKSPDEMRQALDVGIGCFNVESLSEARQLSAVANAAGKLAPVSLRVNPDVDARTHPYIATGLKESKFGIPYADAVSAYRAVAALPGLAVIGVDCHIGSQLLEVAPLMEALDKLIELIDALAAAGIFVGHLDLGGGIGIRYGDEATIETAEYLGRVFERVDRWRSERHDGKPIRLLFEPGRSLVGNAGALLMRTLVLKPGPVRNFAVVDAAMNDLLRPTLYDAWHEVVPVRSDAGVPALQWDLVGPICESGDWLAHDRSLALAEGDLLACLSAGAYGMAMSSNYNSRPRAAEVMVDGQSLHLVRDRETVAQLFAHEHRLP